jgi:hypothetical protein
MLFKCVFCMQPNCIIYLCYTEILGFVYFFHSQTFIGHNSWKLIEIFSLRHASNVREKWVLSASCLIICGSYCWSSQFASSWILPIFLFIWNNINSKTTLLRKMHYTITQYIYIYICNNVTYINVFEDNIHQYMGGIEIKWKQTESDDIKLFNELVVYDSKLLSNLFLNNY